MAVSLNAQKKVNYIPSSTTKISKEWFDKFLIKHQDSVKVIADFYPKNDYDYQQPLLVLHKNNQIEIMLFNVGDSSYITVSPKVPEISNLNLPSNSSCGKEKALKLTHKTLYEAIRFKE